MNTITAIERFRAEHGRYFVVVRLIVGPRKHGWASRLMLIRHASTLRKARKVFPEGNEKGVHLLARVMELALENDGQSCLPPYWIGELNDCDIVLPVQDVTRALPVLQREIVGLALNHVAAIGTFDFDELIWKQIWPDQHGPFEPMRTKCS